MNSRTPPSVRHSSFTGQIGVARADITPPVGIYCRNWGAATHDAAEGVHRPLSLTALVLRVNSNDAPLVLIDSDLGWWRNAAFERKFRSRILKELNLPEANFIFALSHTHSTPPLVDQVEENWKGKEFVAPYAEKVWQRTLEVAKRAIQSMESATIEFHTGRCALATNRDLQDPGRDRIVCGFNPEIEADDTMVVGRITNAKGKPLGTLVNYACHPTTLAWQNKLISPDFPGALRETIEVNTGAPCVFLQGASGELSPRHQYTGDVTVADAHGRQLAFAALATLADMNASQTELAYTGIVESGAPLATWSPKPHSASTKLKAHLVDVAMPMKDWPSAQELEAQRAATTDRTLEERLRRKRDIRRSLGDASTFPLPLHAWEIGDAILIGTMAEAYSWIQIELRRRFPNRTIVFMNLINGSFGYLPPAALYDKDVYQVWQTPCDRGGLEKLFDASVKLIESFG